MGTTGAFLLGDSKSCQIDSNGDHNILTPHVKLQLLYLYLYKFNASKVNLSQCCIKYINVWYIQTMAYGSSLEENKLLYHEKTEEA